jgi:hypothetical protein
MHGGRDECSDKADGKCSRSPERDLALRFRSQGNRIWILEGKRIRNGTRGKEGERSSSSSASRVLWPGTASIPEKLPGGTVSALNQRFGSARLHPALRATLSRRERVVFSLLPPGEGSGMRASGFSERATRARGGEFLFPISRSKCGCLDSAHCSFGETTHV